VANPETQNKISSLISAMVTQIDHDNNWDQPLGVGGSEVGIEQASVDEQTTQAESLDDLFEHYAHEISCDLKLKDRGPDPAPEASLADTLHSRHNRGLQIHEENDRTLEVEQSLPLALVDTETDRVK
jgi:hypothetical protein